AAADGNPTDGANLDRAPAPAAGEGFVPGPIAASAAPPLERGRQIAVAATAVMGPKRDDPEVVEFDPAAAPAGAAETAATGEVVGAIVVVDATTAAAAGAAAAAEPADAAG